MYGKNCIEKWILASSNNNNNATGGTGNNSFASKCPQCNSKAKRSDIRVLYCKKIAALDTAQKEYYEKELDKARKDRLFAQESYSRLQLAYQTALSEIEKSESIIKDLQQKLTQFYENSVHHSATVVAQNNNKESNFHGNNVFNDPSVYCISKDPGSLRMITYDDNSDTVLLSQTHFTQAGTQFGICRVNVQRENCFDFFSVHSKELKCISCSPHQDNLILSGGLDSTLKLSSSLGKTVLLKYSLETGLSPWSCQFDPVDRNIVYCGLNNYSIYTFDLRNTSVPLALLKHLPCISNRRAPIHSLCILPNSENGDLGFIGASLSSVFSISVPKGTLLSDVNMDNIKTNTTMFNINSGICMSLSVVKDVNNSASFLASFRTKPRVSHISGHVNFQNHFKLENPVTILGNSSQQIMTRSTIFSSFASYCSTNSATTAAAVDAEKHMVQMKNDI